MSFPKVYTTADIYGIENLVRTPLFYEILAYYPKDLAKIVIGFLNPKPYTNVKDPKIYLVYKDEWNQVLSKIPKEKIIGKTFNLILWTNSYKDCSQSKFLGIHRYKCKKEPNLLTIPCTSHILDDGSIKMVMGSINYEHIHKKFDWSNVISVRDHLEAMLNVDKQITFRPMKTNDYDRRTYNSIFADQEGTVLIKDDIKSVTSKHDFYVKEIISRMPFDTQYVYIEPVKRLFNRNIFDMCCVCFTIKNIPWKVLNRVSNIMITNIKFVKLTIKCEEQRKLTIKDYACRGVVYKVPLKEDIFDFYNYHDIEMSSLELFWCGIPIIFKSQELKETFIPHAFISIRCRFQGTRYDIRISNGYYVS